MEKSVQKYFALVKIGPASSGPIYNAVMKWKEAPIEGVKLEEAFQVFGDWDFAVLFQADTNDNALHFVGDIIRQLDGVTATSTVPISPLRDFRKT